MPTPILTPAFAGAATASVAPQAINAPAAIFAIVFMINLPSRFGAFECSNAFYVAPNMDRRNEPPRTRKFMLRSLLPEVRKSGGFDAFSLRKHLQKKYLRSRSREEYDRIIGAKKVPGQIPNLMALITSPSHHQPVRY
jgi:hypothetical protein